MVPFVKHVLLALLHFLGGRCPAHSASRGQFIENSPFGALLRQLLACLRTLHHPSIPIFCDQVLSPRVRVRLCELYRPFRHASRPILPRAYLLLIDS